MSLELVTAIRAVLLGEDDETAPVNVCVLSTTLDDADGIAESVDGLTLDIVEDGSTRPFLALTLDGAEVLGRELLRVVAESRGAFVRTAGEA